MSSAAAWSYTAKATLWPMLARADWDGGVTWGPPVPIACDYSGEARVLRDDLGDEYSSREAIYTERADIKRGDRILIGTSSLADPIAAGAREVRSVHRFGDTFERKADDYLIGTI